MGPIACFPLEFLLNIPAPRNHIHSMDELMDPLGYWNILRSPTSFEKRNVFLGIFNAFVSISQF
jgi:hypothetical protein